MESPYVHSLPAEVARTVRVRAISTIGPTVMAAGVIWAILQPYRLTLLHPLHQGLWWLVFEPPLLVVLAGLAFVVLVARPLLADLEARDAAAR
jgi:ABC-type amino acid transport system permease subunit